MIQRVRFWVLELVLKPVVDWARGKKTVLGAISLLLWVAIYAIPAVKPELAYVADAGKLVKEFLEGAGLSLDKELLGAGLGLTVVGLVDKVRRYLKERVIW